MRRTKLDKFISGLILFASIAWFFIQKMTNFFSTHGLGEINDIIPFIAVLSTFYMVWSFAWDKKADGMYKNISEYEREFTDEFFKERKELRELLIEDLRELKELLVVDLSKPPLIESRILFEHETDLSNYLSLKSNTSEYAQIYVITNDAGVENDDFGDAIRENIINNHQYVYMTPFEEETFMEKLCDTLFKTIPKDIDKSFLDAAIKKNVRHIQNKNFFEMLPEYSDMVIYQKKKQVSFNSSNDIIYGFYSFQNGSNSFQGINTYFYNEMTKELAIKIVGCIDNLLANKEKVDLSSANYITKKVKKDKSKKYDSDGLICITPIQKGEIILKKGGRFILKEDLDTELFLNVMYNQVSADYVISSLTPNEDKAFGFPINHNCRCPNCGFASAIEIVATRNIEQGEEILIDYAYFDPGYNKFTCKGCNKCTRLNLSEDDIIKELRSNKDILQNVSPYLKYTIEGDD